jgi:hypothetical protein
MTTSHNIPGGVLRNGVLIKTGGASLYGKDHNNFARNGSSKKLTVPALATGMKRVTAPSHEFLHGAPVNDESLQKTYEGRQVAVHPAMTSKQVANSDLDHGSALLEEAGRLGAPNGK